MVGPTTKSEYKHWVFVRNLTNGLTEYFTGTTLYNNGFKNKRILASNPSPFSMNRILEDKNEIPKNWGTFYYFLGSGKTKIKYFISKDRDITKLLDKLDTDRKVQK